MIPSDRWFPTNLAARAVWFANFKIQFPLVSPSLGVDSYNAQVDNDNSVFQFLTDIQNQLKAFDEAVRQYRKIITENPLGQPVPEFPPMPKFNLPIVIPTGMFERLDKLRNKILAADNYTDEIGALLGILAKKPDSISPGDIKPKIEVTASQSGYMFAAIASNRGGSDSWDVMIRRAGQEKWAVAKTATGKSVDVTVVPSVEGKPEQLQVMIQLKKNNANYGLPSDVVYVTVNP